MRQLFYICALGFVLSFNAQASHYVRGYTRSNGTYVQGHMSMDPGESRSTGLSYHHNMIVPRGQYNDEPYSNNNEYRENKSLYDNDSDDDNDDQ
jgi:hypothetical protein